MKKVLLPVLAAAAMASAESHTHDGFFLNMSLGGGYLSYDFDATKDYESTKIHQSIALDYSGSSINFTLKLGGRIANNLLLHATISETASIRDVDAKINTTIDDETITSRSYGQSSGILIRGIGVTYYLPENIYFTGSVGMGHLTIDTNNSSDNGKLHGTEGSFGFQLGVGKEWWVSDNWGIGASLVFDYSDGTDSSSGSKGEGSAKAVHLMFSATFN